MSQAIVITDVSPRDGLQNQAVHLSTQAKLELVRLLQAAGVASVEVASFVSPRAVPQMADAAAVLAGLAAVAPGLRSSVLTPNLKGLERAIEAGAREIAVVLSATETMNQRNINMDLATATAVSEETLRAALAAGIATRAYIAVAVECPFEGLVAPATVVALAERMLAAGASEIVFADTIGAASPAQLRALLQAAAPSIPLERTAVHLHDTRGFGVANAWAALEAGVRRFDASAGGIGGCPFAPGAAGNLATEDLVLLARQSGLDTGISLEGLDAAVAFAEQQLGRPLGGRSLAWHRRKRKPQ
ncbi:hydroxymethylglutaryl-CoA lyase [uncultured Ramlibacter sp.]|mgnify:CR=1 FL=1|uniref:hydroxymethylglutaryl-CoA lyase n=1 Tax=uncultured Ramlibacter sp. TaxID=260755 RepID=UPI00261AC028|nr:hydroxymethylglutaryl-CoA lyase [uncultured Ramlibacter sp.]